MDFFSHLARLACARIYISSGSADDMLVPFILVLSGLFVFALIFFLVALSYAKRRKNKDQDKPFQTLQGAKVVEKKDTEASYAPICYTFDLREGGRIALKAYQPELRNLVVGDVVDLSFRGETMESCRFSGQGGGQT